MNKLNIVVWSLAGVSMLISRQSMPYGVGAVVCSFVAMLFIYISILEKERYGK